MPDHNPIVVVQKFNSVIEANIVKAKLDAYGIPCFLSEENLTLLTTHLLSGGVRLHIFENDRDEVSRILMQETLQKSEDQDLMVCPKCRSKRILNTAEKPFSLALVVKLILNLSKKHYCLDCETEFDE